MMVTLWTAGTISLEALHGLNKGRAIKSPVSAPSGMSLLSIRHSIQLSPGVVVPCNPDAS